MKKNIFLISVLLLLSLLSCHFGGEVKEYERTANTFVEYLLEENYEGVMEEMALEHQAYANTNMDTLRAGFEGLRERLVGQFGKGLSCKLFYVGNIFAGQTQSLQPNSTAISVELVTEDRVGIMDFLFDNKTRKILLVYLHDFSAPKPAMTWFWLFALLSLSVPIFNIYVLRLIKQSTLRRKWLKYLAVVLLNIPTLAYSPLDGFSVRPLAAQMLLGIGFSLGSYVSAMWYVGVPLGGLWWYWKLRQKKDLSVETDYKG